MYIIINNNKEGGSYKWLNDLNKHISSINISELENFKNLFLNRTILSIKLHINIILNTNKLNFYY